MLTADQSGATYQWVDCDNANAPIANETNQSFTASSSGNYAVEVTVNGCTETSNCVAMVVTGIYNNAIEVSIYPNPARDNLIIKTKEKLQELRLHSANGSLIKSYSQNLDQIDVSDLTAGVYLLQAISDKGVSQTRFVKE